MVSARLRRHWWLAMVLAVLLFLALPRSGRSETTLEYKWEDYREQSDRIRVKAQYVRAEVDLNTSTRLSVESVHDAISGATPTGQPITDGSDQVPTSYLVETRDAGTIDLAHDFENTSLSIQYARSSENDYKSDGYSATWVQNFNQKNTQLQFGFSYVDDDIEPFSFTEPKRKISRDLLIGITQVLGPDMTLTANFVHGSSSGYLSDPYKLVQKDIEIVPGLSLPLTFGEHRPSFRTKDILFVQLTRYFEGLRGSAESSLRYFRDDHGIRSGTFELAWYQRVGSHFVIRPNFRFYRQSAADYYHTNLDETNIVPVETPDATTPFYSSDYRLSKFDATTVGLKVTYNHNDRWSIDAMFERYAMHGRDATPRSAYATANTITLGAKLWF